MSIRAARAIIDENALIHTNVKSSANASQRQQQSAPTKPAAPKPTTKPRRALGDITNKSSGEKSSLNSKGKKAGLSARNTNKQSDDVATVTSQATTTAASSSSVSASAHNEFDDWEIEQFAGRRGRDRPETPVSDIIDWSKVDEPVIFSDSPPTHSIEFDANKMAELLQATVSLDDFEL